MKKTYLAVGLGGIILTACIIFSAQGCSTGNPVKVETGISNQYANLPLDINGESQKEADLFSWQTFIAMSWPANTGTCGPDTSNGISVLSGKGPLVWETYLSSDQVFVTAPNTPDPWCANGTASVHFKNLPKKVQDLARKTGVYRVIHRISKSSSPHGLDQAVGGPLVDQNGRFARYEVRMNADEYNYITTNSLWDTIGQDRFAKSNTVSLPAGPTNYGPAGAMEIKAAWKVLGAGDDTTKFYKIRAIVYNDDSGDPSPGENPVTLGLVGLHIARKTATQRNWVWSTFEHVDNLTKSFYNQACDTCPVNQPLQGPHYIELNPDGTPHNRPTQVTRINAVTDPFVDSVNIRFQTLLRGSVWANYKLVSTQWLLFENMFPSYLANSVQETYVQGPNPPYYGGFPLREDEQYYTNKLYNPFAKGISASCMGCHYVATMPNAPSAKADFSFLLGEAH